MANLCTGCEGQWISNENTLWEVNLYGYLPGSPFEAVNGRCCLRCGEMNMRFKRSL